MNISEVQRYLPEVISWRRDFHMHPELGFHEVRTAGIVAEKLESFGLRVVTGFAETAVMGILETNRPGNVVAIRADMDALPMQDQKDVPYRSVNDGVCHSCGHDSHTANLLGVAKYVMEHQEEFCGTIKFLFQPAEEIGRGGQVVMESGLLDDVDYMFAAHNTPQIDSGKLMVRYGYANAASYDFHITLKGKGCHGARPNTGKDLVVISTDIINGFQAIVSREVDPLAQLVISICSLNAGIPGTTNVIPNDLHMSGTVRVFNDQVGSYAVNKMQKIVEKVCELHEIESEMQMILNVPSLCNNKEVTDVVKEACIEVVGAENVLERPEPTMGTEDFAYYTKKLKACNFYFGSRNEERGIVVRGHHPKFDIEENCLQYSMAAFLTVLKKLLVK